MVDGEVILEMKFTNRCFRDCFFLVGELATFCSVSESTSRKLSLESGRSGATGLVAEPVVGRGKVNSGGSESAWSGLLLVLSDSLFVLGEGSKGESKLEETDTVEAKSAVSSSGIEDEIEFGLPGSWDSARSASLLSTSPPSMYTAWRIDV